MRHFLSPVEADDYFQSMLNCIDWSEEVFTIYGRSVKAPRLMAWYGDSGASYRYSGVSHDPMPWIEPLITIKKKLFSSLGYSFNSVLANLYRNGQDSMGWHADNETELGKNPVIASLSFGQERRFCLRHNDSKEQLDLQLGHGSLLVMSGETQHYWKHALPKTKQQLGCRINLTFRMIL